MKARFAKCLILVLALALLLCGCGKGEFTTTYSMDGIIVTVHTDKAAYVGTETAKVNMEITNNTGKEIAVSADVKTPDGLAVDLETLGGNFKAEPGKVVTLYDIGIKLNPLGLILWIAGGVVVLAAAAVVVIIILRKNKGKQAMAMLLCLVMLGGMVAYIQPLQAEASVFDDPQEPTPDYVGQMTVRHPVMVDGAQVYIEAVLDYEIGLPIEPVYEPLVEETDYVDPDTKKPNGKVLAWYYNDYDGDHAMYDKGANAKLYENSMELAGTQEQGYLRIEILNAATSSYQADFRDNALVDNFVVHFKVSTENQIPNGTYMLYRYNSKKNTSLFSFKDGYLRIGSKDYNKVVAGEWMEFDIVFDLTPEANDLATFYVNGRYVTELKLPKHEELYKIPYVRWHVIGTQETIGSTLLVDDFAAYPGKDVLSIDQINTPNYPYYQQHTVAPDVAIDHPELEDLGDKVIAVLAGSDQAYVNGEVITMSAEAIDRSSGSVFTDASVPGDFLEKYLGVTGLDASQQYSLLQYATGKNIAVDSRGLIILTDDVVLDVDSTDIRIVTLLYGYLATGKLVNNYAIMPALDQDMVDKAVHNTEIYPTTVVLRSYDAMATDIALYYLVLAARLDPDRTSTDGISVEAEAVRRLKNMVAGGHEPMAAVGNSWEHGVVSSALTLARFTPNLWNQLTKEEQEKVDLLMECLAIAANWGYNLDNNYITPFDLRGSFAKNLNPNFLYAYITCYFNASMYFGAEELDEIFVNFSHAEYVERLKNAGFTNILYQWTIKDNLGLDIGYYMENGGEVLLLGDDAVIANGSAGSSLKAGETGGTGVGVKVPFKYEGLLTRKIYDSSQLLEMFMDTLELNYCWKVMSSNQAPGTMYYSYILTMVKSPWEGQMGMMRELSIGDDRSKVRYSWLSAINIAPLFSNFKLLGYWDYDANPELTQRMLELENRVYVGTEDLYFKMHQGYQGCSQKKQVEELDSGFVNEGADMIEDIFMNFLFMKNQQIVYTQPEVAQDLLAAAEPMNGITEPPEDAVVTIARDPSNNYAWDLWSPLNPGVGYTSGNMSFDIVIEDQLVDSGFRSYIVIDKKFPGKGLTESPMAIYFDQLTGISVLDKNQFMPLGIFFGANYRFHVDMEFNCKDRSYSGTITQTWPETEKPITATFNNGFRTTATMSWSFVDSMMALTYTGYPLLWVENIQVDGSTLTPPTLELTEDVTVTMDMSGLPTWARPSELKVNLAIGDWVSPRTVTFSAADGWSSKVFDNLPIEIGNLPVNWTVQMLQNVPGYYATVTKTGENKFTVSWSDTHYFYDNNFEAWNKGEYVAKNTLIYDSRGNGLRDYNDKASWGELTRGTEASGNDYLKIGGTKPAQATFGLDTGAEAGIYVFKMRLKLEKAEDMIMATHFAYRYLKGEKNVKNTFINIEKNRLEVGGYVLGTLTADEWMDIMVMLDFKTGVGEVFYDDPGYRRTFELDPISTSAITLFSTNNNGVLCIDDLQVYTCSRLTVVKPPDEANKKAELIIPETPIPELDPAYKWYYSTDFEYWNKGDYVAGKTPIMDAYGNTMIDQWSNSYGPLVRSGDESGNHFLELNSYKTMQAQLFVDEAHDDGTYIMKWRMKLKDENSAVSSVVFSYRNASNKKVDFATITEKAVKICGKSLGKLTADEWLEVMVVLDFNTSTATLCDWEGHAISTMALKPIGGRMFNIFANGGTKGLCIDDLQLYSGSVTILDPLPGQPGDEEEPDAPADVAFESNFDAALPTEPDGEAYTYLVDANGNKLSVTNGAYSVNDGYLAVSGSADANNYLFIAEGAADVLDISFKVRLPDADTTIPGKVSSGISLRTYKNDADIAKFYGQNFRINGKNYALRADQWLDISIQVDLAADKVTYNVGGETGEFEFTGPYSRLELFALAKGAFTLHIDDLKISNGKNEEDAWTGTLETTVVWNDSADDDGIRPEGVYVSLYNGLNLVDRKLATAESGWKCAFTELSQYDPEGNPIGYTVVVTSEDVPEGYEVAIAGAKVTLTHVPETIYYYNNDFENNDLQGIGGETEIADNNNRILTDFNGYFLTHVDAETGNTFLELADETAAQAASSRMTFAAGPIQVSFRVRLAEGVESIGANLRLRTAKNGWFAAFSGKNLVVNDGEGTSFTLGEEWIDVTFIIEPESKVTYQIGDAAPVQFAYTAACGRFEIFNNSGDAYSGLYMDDLQISVYEAPEVDPEEPTEPGEQETEAPTEPTEAPTEPETEAPTEPEQDENAVSVSLENAFGGADSIVTMTWDDAGMASSNYNTALFLNEQYRIFGLKGTLMAVTKGDKGFDSESRRLQWLDILKDGNLEMQSHSATHMYIGKDDDAEADKVNNTPENYQAEIAGSKASLEEWVPNEILAFAAAGNSMSTDGWVVVQENYYATRMGVRGVQSIDPAMGIAVGAWQNLMTQRLGTSTTNTELDRMKGYVDDAIAQKGWLITFAHNISDSGDVTEDTAKDLFRYIADKVQSNEVWCANFGDAIRYIRERQNSTVVAVVDGDTIKITVTMAATAADGKSLPANIFNHPLTAKVEVPAEWTLVTYAIDGKKEIVKTFTEDGATWAYVNILPNTTATVAEATAATTIDREVTLVWDDAADSDGIRPATVDVQVYNGQTLVTTATVSAANDWVVTLQLPKYDAQLNEITYTFNAEVEHYDDTYAAGVLTLSHTPVITYFYNNNFESDTLTVGSALTSVLDANNKTAIGQFYVREETNNKFLELKYDTAGQIAACQVTGTGNDYEVRFRVRLGAGVSTIGTGATMRVRSTGSGWFAAFSGNQILTSDGASVTLTDEWLDVYFHVDGVNQKVTYRIGETTGTIEQYETTVDRFQIFNYRAAAYSGLYIDDLKISEYKAPEEPEEPTEPGEQETEAPTEPTEAPTEPETEPTEPDTTTYFYNNDFESYIFADKNPGWIGKEGYVLDANGNSIQDPMGYCYILEDAGNNYLNIAGSGNKVYLQHVSETNPISGAVKISFRVRLAEGFTLPANTNLHFRTNSQWFTAVMKDSNGADVLACRTGNYPLSDEWLQVTVVIDGATVTYTIGDNPSTSTAFAYDVNGFDIRMNKNMGFTSGGVHIDDLKISVY